MFPDHDYPFKEANEPIFGIKTDVGPNGVTNYTAKPEDISTVFNTSVQTPTLTLTLTLTLTAPKVLAKVDGGGRMFLSSTLAAWNDIAVPFRPGFYKVNNTRYEQWSTTLTVTLTLTPRLRM